MDPDANLAEQAKLARRILAADDAGDYADHDASRLAELVEALDEWIRRGGFLPQAWKR